MVSLLCQHCGITFSVPTYRKASAHFCSKSCTNLGTIHKREPERLKAIRGKLAYNNANLTKLCEQCGSIFSVSPSRINLKFYCSQTCYTKSQQKPPRLPYKTIIINGVRQLEHRYLIEQHLQRKLTSKEHVHHIDGNPTNNQLTNLEVLDIAEHAKRHGQARKRL